MKQGYTYSIAVKTNRCPNEFCTRLYPHNEKNMYRFHKNAHNTRTAQRNRVIFSGCNECVHTFIILV